MKRPAVRIAALIVALVVLVGAGFIFGYYARGTGASSAEPVRSETPTAIAPVLVRGILKNPDGTRAAGALVEVYAWSPDASETAVGEAVETPFVGSAVTRHDGRYVVRVPTWRPPLHGYARQNSGWINLELRFYGTDPEREFAITNVPRKLSGNGWLADDNPDQSAENRLVNMTLETAVPPLDLGLD